MRTLALAVIPGTADSEDGPSRLLEAARAGDLAAFECLMRRHERLVLATALRLAGSLPDAQDVSQEVFLKLYRNLGKLGSEEAVTSWLYRVTVNACNDLRRKRGRRPESPVEAAGQMPSEEIDPQRAATEAERRRALEFSLRMLPEKERAAIVLRDLEGLPTSEVARILGSSEATVRSQISTGRIKMRGFVERFFGRRS
jgi:RNA polymerase sigma-70 factor, ECF subfamily